MQAYDYVIIYKKEGNIADFKSRNFIPKEIHNDSDENEVAAYVNFLLKKMTPKSKSLEDIKTETATDIISVAVKTALLSGRLEWNLFFAPDQLLYSKC